VVNWNTVSPREMQALSEKMLRAASVTPAETAEFYRAFNKYIYDGKW